MKYPDSYFTEILEELLYISKFTLNKKEVKHERKIVEKMIRDIKENKIEKYVTSEDDNNE